MDENMEHMYDDLIDADEEAKHELGEYLISVAADEVTIEFALKAMFVLGFEHGQIAMVDKAAKHVGEMLENIRVHD